MQDLFRQAGVTDYIFFDAVDKDSREVAVCYREEKVASFPPCFRCKKLRCGDTDCNNVLIPAQVATFLSYKNLWDWLAQSTIKNALIVEDDIVLSEDASQRAEAIINKNLIESTPLLDNEQPFLLRFGWALCDEHHSTAQVSLETFSRMSNPAHAINRKMAERLSEAVKTINTTVDIFQHKNHTDEQNSLTCFPPLFYELSWSTGKLESLIHPKPVRLDYLTSQQQDAQLIEETRRKIQSHKKHVSVYKILGLGHPRCGSGYTASLLSALKLDVGHEEMKTDGIVSWMFASDHEAPWAKNEGARSKAFKHFEYVIHHVRDPREAIPSIIRDNIYSPPSYQYRKNVIKQNFSIDMDTFDSHLERAVVSYIYWNELCLGLNPDITYRIEDQETLLIEELRQSRLIVFDDSLNHPVPKNINENKKYNGVRYSKIAIGDSDFAEISTTLLNKLNYYCAKFGYRGFDNE